MTGSPPGATWADVGEALGVWLWAVLWPPAAELVLLEHVVLHDLRHEAHASLDLPLGAPDARPGSRRGRVLGAGVGRLGGRHARKLPRSPTLGRCRR